MSRGKSKCRPPAMQCPHCNTQADIRTSKCLTTTFREISYRCRNDACGCQFVASLETIRIVVQSATPNPEICLPFSNRRRLMTPANDDLPLVIIPPAANDTILSDTG